MRTRRSDDEKVWPIFLIGPILAYYGGDTPMTDMGWRPYKCPFHGDRTASASINTILNVFVCHSCEIKGNAVQVIMKKEAIPYAAALSRAKEITGQSVDPVSKSPGRGGGVSGRSRNRSGSRAFKRNWGRT